jgi:hypothetical protein
MRLLKVFSFFLLLTSFSVSLAQNSGESPELNNEDASSTDEAVSVENSASEELIELRNRLGHIESMLLAQKDREEELLSDLGRDYENWAT